eukprot:72832-Chlamydomonas_euryale.AAC.1
MVPSSDGVLVDARRCVYVRAGGSARLLGRVPRASLTWVHPHVPPQVAAWMGCAELSSVAHETLDPGRPLAPLSSAGDGGGSSGDLAAAVRTAVAAPSFARACYSVHSAHVPLLKGMTPLGLQEVRRAGMGVTARTSVAAAATLVRAPASMPGFERCGRFAEGAPRSDERRCGRTSLRACLSGRFAPGLAVRAHTSAWHAHTTTPIYSSSLTRIHLVDLHMMNPS